MPTSKSTKTIVIGAIRDLRKIDEELNLEGMRSCILDAVI